MRNGQNLLKALDGFLESVTTNKAAEAASTAGHVQNQGDSGTSHPSKSVDDGTQEATEGSRSAENTADVKSDVPGQPVDAAKEDKLDGASENPLTTAKPTGEDPANETSSTDGLIGGEAGKDSSGKDTTHPAKVDFGGKYASIKEAAAGLTSRINAYNAKLAALDIPPKPDAKKAAASKAAAAEPATADPPEPGASAESAADPPPEPPAEGKGEDATKEAAASPDADVAAGKQAAETAVAQLVKLASGKQTSAELVTALAKHACADANLLGDMYEGIAAGATEAEKEARVKTARAQATVAYDGVKTAMETEMAAGGAGGLGSADAGADAMAFGGEGEQPGATDPGAGAAAGAGGGEIEQIIQALVQAGIDPNILAEIDPADLAEAIAEMQGGGGGEEAMMGAPELGAPEMGVPPEEGAAPELAPAAAM
jgi:hypothetical protein